MASRLFKTLQIAFSKGMDAIRGMIAADPPKPWTEREDSLLALGRRMFGSDCCKLARLVGTRSCQEIAQAVDVPSQEAGVDCTAEDNDAEIQKDAAKKRTALASQVCRLSKLEDGINQNHDFEQDAM